MNIIEEIKTLQTQAQNKNTQPQYTQSNIEMLRAQLRFVCDKIEETLIHAINPQKEKEQKEEELLNIPHIEDQYPIGQTINNYKEQSQQSKYKLETVYNITKLEALESGVKTKREKLKEKYAENSTLVLINQNQQRGIKEYEDKYHNKKEVMQLGDKLKTAKEEVKITKEYMKGLDAQIKGQLSQMTVLKEKCQIIKDNIEYKKKQQMKEVQNMIDDTQKDTIDIAGLEEHKSSIENQVLFEEKGYKTEIGNQIELIERLKSELDILVVKIKQIEQSKRITELKMKEITKIHQKESKRVSKQTERTSGKEVKMFKMKSTNKKDNEMDEMNKMSKTPHIKMNNKMMKKPFEIHKFNNETNYSNKKPPELENNDMLKEIENLKNEIQNAIRINNAHLAQIPTIPKEKMIINKMNEQSSILPLDVDSNHLEIKNEEEFEYLKDIETDEPNSGTDDIIKNKPFLAINFGGIK